VYKTSSVTNLNSWCNVFWENEAGNAGGSYVLGPTDRELDPQFCDPEGGDYRLAQSSPCLPLNSGECGQIGALGQGCGVVSVSAESWGKIKDAYREGGRP
jgi:hypothetical protein